jgi:cytoskeletal protein CcmA (bactofilin family)
MKGWGKSEQISGFLDQGIHVTGELHFGGILRIDGNFHGSISSGDTLIIGEHAVVHADIKVGELELHGQVFGNVEAKHRVEISASGRLRGDLQTSVLLVQAGGVLEGRSRMPSDSDADEPALVRESTTIAREEHDESRERV